MKNSPLSLICLVFCLGIWTAKVVHIPLFLLYACLISFLAFALVSLKNNQLFLLFLGAAIFCSGIIRLENAQLYPADHISKFVFEQARKVYIRGKVISAPEVSRTIYYSQKSAFTFGADDLKLDQNWRQVQGAIKVNLYGEREVNFGDVLLLQGSLSQAKLKNIRIIFSCLVKLSIAILKHT